MKIPLSKTHPDISKMWHPTKNGILTSEKCTSGSHKKVWWTCHLSHEWQSEIHTLVGCVEKRGLKRCPECRKQNKPENNLVITHPEIAKQWHPTKNGEKTPDMFTFGCHQYFWWKCVIAEDHVWRATISNRVKITSRNKGGCPFCINQKVSMSNCLSTKFPEIASEWHPCKNGILTPDMVVHGCGKRVWWKCSKGHEWQAKIYSRSNGRNCPICNQSKGEIYVERFLTDKKIVFERQYSDYSCRNVNPLLFDFKLEFNGIKLIEFQGEQHYKEKSYIGGMKTFEKIKKRDQIKRDWCKSNNIPLLEIPYWDIDNIEKVICNFLQI